MATGATPSPHSLPCRLRGRGPDRAQQTLWALCLPDPPLLFPALVHILPRAGRVDSQRHPSLLRQQPLLSCSHAQQIQGDGAHPGRKGSVPSGASPSSPAPSAGTRVVPSAPTGGHCPQWTGGHDVTSSPNSSCLGQGWQEEVAPARLVGGSEVTPGRWLSEGRR